MDTRVTALSEGPDPTPSPIRSGARWAGVFLVMAGVAFGYLLADGATSGLTAADVVTSLAATVPPSVPSEPPTSGEVTFPGTLLASVEFGKGLVMWRGDRGPMRIGLAADVAAAEFDAHKNRIAVTFLEYGSDGLALHIGRLSDLRFVTSGVTGFVWHPTDREAIAWVEKSGAGFALVRAVVSEDGVDQTRVAVLADEARPVAWGSWGFALEDDDGLMTMAPSGEIIANGDLQFVAAASDGRLIVARPAGTPLSSDWAITGPDLRNQQALERFADFDEHPTAAAILPVSGRIVLVSNRFGDGADVARIEILDADGTLQTEFRSGMTADSIAWSPDGTRLAVGGYYYGSNQVRSVVLLADADGTGEPIELPFEHEVRPIGLRN